MTVEVTIKLPSGQLQTRSHEDGKIVLVRDGNLFVQAYSGGEAEATVAVYAPGTWIEAGQVKE